MRSGSTSPPWWSVTVRCDPSRAELAADVVWSFGPPAVEERLDPDSGCSLLLSGFADHATANDAAQAVASLPGCVAEVSAVTDDGLDAWRAHASVVHAGPFVLVPAWMEHDVAPGEVALRLDPGRAFGSGSHPTTRLTLEAAAPHLRAGGRVLDVGCGSGVLSIAAALLGAHVLAVDVDPLALEATRANAATNGVARHVAVDPRPLADVVADDRVAPFELVLANLLAPTVRDLAAPLARSVGPAGRLIVSGLLADRWHDAIDAVLDADGTPGGLTVDEVTTAEGWVAVSLTSPPPS